MKVHHLKIDNIYQALAMEEALFQNLPKNEKALIFWSNTPAVVMGRFQNPWVECHLPKMRDKGVVLARRQSGGGTVFHDHGNVNISFLDWNENYDKERNNKALVGALKELGHSARSSGRSDIQVETADGLRKVSGAAFKQKRDRSFHHCTMLLNSDLEALNSHLRSSLSPDQVDTKAIASVRSKVANINVSKEKFFRTLKSSWETELGSKAEVVNWSADDCLSYINNEAQAYLEKLMSWKWIFGETPFFQTQYSFGKWRFELGVKKGIIKNFEANHDDVHPGLLQALAEELVGAHFKLKEMEKIIIGLKGADVYSDELKELINGLNMGFGLDFNAGNFRAQ